MGRTPFLQKKFTGHKQFQCSKKQGAETFLTAYITGQFFVSQIYLIFPNFENPLDFQILEIIMGGIKGNFVYIIYVPDLHSKSEKRENL